MGSYSITVEPLIFILSFSLITYNMSYQLYLFERLSEKYNLTSSNHSSSPCSSANTTNPNFAKVSAESSQLGLEINIAGKVIGLKWYLI